MNFALRGTDACETAARGGKHFVRFVDAKFALPGAAAAGAAAAGTSGGGAGGASAGASDAGGGAGSGVKAAQSGDFVCLDVLEYATEHDDIFVGFDGEEGTWCYSAPAVSPSR